MTIHRRVRAVAAGVLPVTPGGPGGRVSPAPGHSRVSGSPAARGEER